MLSFVVAAIACVTVALCYAEFAATVPVGGSAYTYAYATLGELPAWLIGWNLVSCYLLGAASVAQGWSHYFQSFLGSIGFHLPHALTVARLDYNPGLNRVVSTGALFDLPAALIICAITLVIIRGITTGIRFNLAMLVVKIAVIVFVIVVGALHIHPANWHPFAPYGFGGLNLFGKTWGLIGSTGHALGMFAGAALVFYAFIGFDALSTYTDECRNPRRDVPAAILASVGIITAIYIAMSAVLTGMVKYTEISDQAPVSEAFRQVGMPWAQSLVAAGALTGITGVLLIMLMSLPRIPAGNGAGRPDPDRASSTTYTFASKHPGRALFCAGRLLRRLHLCFH